VSAGTRVPLAEATRAAEQLATVLGLGCSRITIAGSIRRLRPDVGDIELVAVPRVHTETLREGLFETRELLVDELQVVLDTLLMDGTLAAHPMDPKRGARYSKWLHVASGIQLDLFSARPETYGLALLIRTGSADYSHRFVTQIRGRGWHVGGGMELHRGPLACADRIAPCEAVPTPEEADVYRHVRLTFIEPEDRA
jgi:DNA polymerase/3'-5' exonuclease PolX